MIIPADVPAQIQSLVTQGVGNPTVDLILNSQGSARTCSSPTRRSRRGWPQVEQAVSKQVLRVAVNDLQQVLNGGSITLARTERARCSG